MSRSQKPPTPDLSKTFWKPDFPKDRENVIRREHPILRWGDYDTITDLYIWQKERFKGDVSSVYTSRMKKALAGIWYGVENDPRCDHCERADRSCTMAVTNTHGTKASQGRSRTSISSVRSSYSIPMATLVFMKISSILTVCKLPLMTVGERTRSQPHVL
jgi:hypothetical protein